MSNCSIISRPVTANGASTSSTTQDHLSTVFQIACTEGFSGGLPQNFLLEIFFIPSTSGSASSASSAASGNNSSNNWQLFVSNQTSMKPVFNLRGLNVLTPSLTAASASATDGGHYVAHVTAVNAKGRSDAVTVRLSLQQQQRLSQPPQMTGHGSSGGGIKNSATGSNGSSGGGGSGNGGKSEGQSNSVS